MTFVILLKATLEKNSESNELQNQYDNSYKILFQVQLYNPIYIPKAKCLLLYYSQMKVKTIEFPSGKSTPLNSSKKVVLPILTLILLTTIPLYLYKDSPSTLPHYQWFRPFIPGKQFVIAFAFRPE